LRTLNFIIFFILIFGTPIPLRADVVHLKSGDTIEGKVEDLGDSVKIEAKGAVITIPKSRIERIEVRKLPKEIYAERLKQLDTSNVEDCLALARWCREQGLDDEYAVMLRYVLAIDPENAEAKKLLYEYEKLSQVLPVSEQACQRLLREFGSSFRIKRTRHYRICYNCDMDFLLARCSLLEKVYRRFYEFFESNGFELSTLRDRLEVVLFDSRDDFIAYLRREAAKPDTPPHVRANLAAMMRSSGMYWKARNRAIFYNALHDANYRAMRERIEALTERIRQMKKIVLRSSRKQQFELEFADGSRRRMSRAEVLKLIAADEKRLKEAMRMLSYSSKRDENIETTVHEATHQLCFNIGVLNPNADNPLWLVEGLATFFEPASYGSWTGAGRINDLRLKDFKLVVRRTNLRDLLVNDAGFLSGTQEEIASSYARAWALVYFLFQRHKTEFMKYVRFLSRKPAGYRPDANGRISDFQTFFPDLEKLEAEWNAFMRKLK